jgi:hypothetical protein
MMKTRLFALALSVCALGVSMALKIDAQTVPPNWAQVNPNGFGDTMNVGVYALASFNGQLYAGTANDNGAQLWRRTGISWSPVMTNGFGSPGTFSIDVLYPFNGQLYAGTADTANGGEIWRSSNGLGWTRVVTSGLGEPGVNGEAFTLAVLSDTLYAGTLSYSSTQGAQIWKTHDGMDWTRAVTNGFGNHDNNGIYSFEAFNGYLYAGTGNAAAAELWRGNGASWTPANTNGFGNANNKGISALAAFKGNLYAGTRNPTQGGELWRSSNGLSWTAVFTGGLGSAANGRLYGLIVFGDRLFLVFSNLATGAQVWQSADGSTWERLVEAGWGDRNNTYADYFDKAATVFDNGLYIGTANNDGGEIWLYKPLIDTLFVAPGGDCGGAVPCYATLQSAVDAASDLDRIKVAAGAYSGVQVRPRNDISVTGFVTQVVYISLTLTIAGGYTTSNWIMPDPVANPTTVNAEGKGRAFYITGDIQPVIEGLRITGGNAAGQGGERTAAANDAGGGIYVWRALATLRSNWIFGNTAGSGGGVTVNGLGYGFPGEPGALIAGNTIVSNTAGSGAGLSLAGSAATVSDNVIQGNAASDRAGGVQAFMGSPVLLRNIVRYNSARNYGGGLHFQWGAPILINNVIADNHVEQAGSTGSGLSITGAQLNMSHNSIAHNTGGDGSGVYVVDMFDWGQPVVFMTNTILVNQPVGLSVNGFSTVTVNGLLWYDTPITVSQDMTATVAVHNPFTGNPSFMADGYHLASNSAAIDQGVNSGVADDIDRQSRPKGIGYDLGADEYRPREVFLPLLRK